MEAMVEVNRDQLDEVFAEYHCACVALNGKGSRESKYAAVTYACELFVKTYL